MLNSGEMYVIVVFSIVRCAYIYYCTCASLYYPFSQVENLAEISERGTVQ